MNPFSNIKSFFNKGNDDSAEESHGEPDYNAESLYHHPNASSSTPEKMEDLSEEIRDSYKSELEREFEQELENEKISGVTKVKVGAALLVVGFASYIAYWVQEPMDIKVAVLENSMETSIDAEPAVAPVEENNIIALNTDNIVEISIVDFTYSPANVTIEKGTTVIWTNLDSVDHTVTSDDFDSGVLGPAASFSYEFAREGDFTYSCTLHPDMIGKISVMGAPESAPEESPATTPIEDLSDEDLDAVIDNLISENNGDLDLALLAAADEASAGSELTMATGAGEEKVLAVLSAESEEADGTHTAAIEDEENAEKLATTGPEDTIYLLAIGFILFLNRRKLGFSLGK